MSATIWVSIVTEGDLSDREASVIYAGHSKKLAIEAIDKYDWSHAEKTRDACIEEWWRGKFLDFHPVVIKGERKEIT